MSVSC